MTALGIDAADTAAGSRATLLGLLFVEGDQATFECPGGMSLLKTGTARVCIDSYEAGVGSACSKHQPESVQETLANVEQTGCIPVSEIGQVPWRYVPYRAAEQLCGKAGKQLISSLVWYQAALGTTDNPAICGVSGLLEKTGEHTLCRSGIGAFDMVGNVWELVQGEVRAGEINNAALPASGYVSVITDDGLPRETSSAPVALYGGDYFSAGTVGDRAVMRGGYYNGGTDAGLYNTHSDIAHDFASGAVGFRCMLIL